MAEAKNPGEDRAWELLAEMQPEQVCRAADASYDPAAGVYRIRSFGMEFSVSVTERTIVGDGPGGALLLGKLSYFFRLSVLWYLASAKEIVCTGRLVNLETLPGGDAFTRGSHALPLEGIARKYGARKDAFLEKAKSLGAEIGNLGDASLRLHPLPRVPVVLVLWLADEEFPARADLLFDSTCSLQIPLDIVWSVAMMSVLVML